MKKHIGEKQTRRGVILVLAVILLVAVMAFVSLTVDVGHMAVVRTQLQGTADAAALAAAQDIPVGAETARASAKSIALLNKAAGDPVTIDDSDIELGFFDFSAKSFVADPTSANAVRVTARVTNQKHFFAPVMGTDTYDMSASAIGMLNPRDIVFVVDLSGSMNDDTEPCWATDAITAQYSATSYSTVATDLMQRVYSDFGFGTYPGAEEYLGAPLGVSADQYAYAEMTKDDGPLTDTAIAATYRIFNSDDEPTRKQKAYAWIIDNQIASVLPNALPTPDSAVNFNYWSRYLDYIMRGTYVGEEPPPDDDDDDDYTPPPSGGPPTPPTTGWLEHPTGTNGLATEFRFQMLMAARVYNGGLWSAASLGLTALPSPVANSYPGCPRRGEYKWTWLPVNYDGDRIYNFNNPNTTSFPTASAPWGWRNWIGYRTYVQFMMDWGRERSPEFDNSSNSNPNLTGKTPLSALNPDCPFRSETTAGGVYQFPPRSEPMHSVRRALIAGLQHVKEKNALVTAGGGDRVSIVTFDGRDGWHGPSIVQPLTSDFDAAMLACTTLQAASDIGATTSTESGIDLARRHLRQKTAASNPNDDPIGAQGRSFTSKVIVLVTDGMPNSWDAEQTELDDYISANSSDEFYPTGYDWFNSVLMQTQQFYRTQRGRMYGVGMGLGTDYDFMDRVARIASTDVNGQSSRGSGNPAEYEQQLVDVLKFIIDRPGSRMVE